ncbi:MAG: type II secretion protein [Thermoproteus sp. JCHS_4]|jgi:ATPases involved in chromosome partitioning|nr:MAG: type II secretion protein [Thermoproteus sp. JCHS_4]
MRTKFAVFFSVDGGVGKTTLALATAFEKERVLVVDADWEKADLSSIFGVPKRPGWLAGHYGKDVYLHKVRPNLYVVPGYEAAMLYQLGKIGDAELFEAVYETLSALPDAVAEERLPVDTVIVDTPKALQLTWIEALQRKLKALMYFVADRRLVTRIADIKMQIYGRYMRYASLIVANMLEKGDEKAPGIRMVNAFLTRVKMPSDYSAERIHRAVLGDRRNKEAISTLVRWIKEK